VAAEAGAEKDKGHAPSLVSRIIGVVIVTLMAAGAAGGSSFYLVRQAKLAQPAQAPVVAARDSVPKETAGKEGAGKEGAAKEGASKEPPPAAPPEDLVSLPVPVVLTNLADPSSIFVRLEAEIITDAKSAKSMTPLVAEISGDYMAYLHSLSVSSFEGPSSLTQLKEDLTDRAQTRSKGLVRDLVIKGLVVK